MGAPQSLWRFILEPGAAMAPAEAESLRPAMARLGVFVGAATADWLLAPALPPGFAAFPPDEILRERLRTRFLRAEARRWLALLAEKDLPVLPLKGFATGLLIYPEPELRGLGDVDLLVRRADLPRLVELLRVQGFAFRKSQGTAAWGLASDASFHPFVAPSGPLSFDLHVHPDDYPLHRALATQAVFAGARETVEAGMALRLPNETHLLLMAMSHAARDKYDPNAVRGVADMAAMLARAPAAVDWDILLALARAGGILRLPHLAAQLLIALGLPEARVPAELRRPFRGLAGWEAARVVAEFETVFAAPPGKLALQRREWLLSAGVCVAARRAARRLRGMVKPWPGVPDV